MKISGSGLEVALWVSLGVVVLGAFMISRHNALSARGSAPLPLKTLPPKPILQVELGRSDRDLHAIFLPDGAGRAELMQNIRDARIGNTLDTFLFIPGYTVLLMSVGVLLARTNVTRTVVFVCVAAVPVAAICDWAENKGIAIALDHLEADKAPHPGDAKRIVKWALLALVLLTYGEWLLWGPAGCVGSPLGWSVSVSVLQPRTCS
jgi:hypothetical protein